MNRSTEDQRKLTKAEQQRKDSFEAQRAQLTAQGYREKDLTIGLVQVNGMALVLGLLLILPFEIAYFRQHPTLSIQIELRTATEFLVLFFVLIFAHELLHGIAWAAFAPSHWRAVSFGFIVQYLTPYCTCGEALKKWQYVFGALLPTILLGIVPIIAAVSCGSLFLFLIGAAMILGGGGDLAIVLKLIMHHSAAESTVYIDHPYQAGLVAFER